MIGIVGGIGPLAGADLFKKILDNTVATVDQDHLPVLLASLPGDIAPRNTFLLGQTSENPAADLARVVRLLERAGATHIGIACNTAHAAPIFQPMLDLLQRETSRAEIVHMISETIAAIGRCPEPIRRVGILCTTGSYQIGLYQPELRAAGLEPILLNFARHETLVQTAIHAIKGDPRGLAKATRAALETAIFELKNLGAEAVLLACTEIGLLDETLDFQGLNVFNPSTELARALIRRAFPERLKV